MAIDRDPRVDPRPGDVLRSKWLEREVFTVIQRPALVLFLERHVSRDGNLMSRTIKDWHIHSRFAAWAKTSSIIRKGDA